jgi:hypothetical protein
VGISYGYQTKGVAVIAIHIVIKAKELKMAFGEAVQMVIKTKELGFTGGYARACKPNWNNEIRTTSS